MVNCSAILVCAWLKGIFFFLHCSMFVCFCSWIAESLAGDIVTAQAWLHLCGVGLPRLTVIPVLSHNTVTSLARRGTVPQRHLDFFFFYSNTNYFVQLEDTKIKTERNCSMQRTERTRVLHHSSLGLHNRLSRPDFLRRGINFNEYNAVTVGNSGAIWTGAGSLTLSRSQTSFQNSISVLYYYRSPVQPALGPLRAHCTHEWTSASFYCLCTACVTMLRAG